MQTQPRSWRLFQRYNVVSFVVSTCFIVACGLSLAGVALRTKVEGAHVQTLIVCAQTDRTHIVVKEDTLMGIAAHYGQNVQQLVTYNRLSDPNSVHINQSICIPSIPSKMMGSAILAFKVPEKSAAPLVLVKRMDQMHDEKRDQPAAPAFQAVKTSRPSGVAPYTELSGFAMQAPKEQAANYRNEYPMGQAANYRNEYPTGQCTWWAAQRYYQLHDISLPWIKDANAGEWVGRAKNFGWHVSSVPIVGSILVLHQNVQGAGPVGHVAIVEKVLSNGTVIASSMNWGKRPHVVTNSQFHQGSGVSFIDP